MKIHDSLTKEYLDGFNQGYLFASWFPEFTHDVITQNSDNGFGGHSEHEQTAKEGVLDGLCQHLLDYSKKMPDKDLKELDDLRSTRNLENEDREL